MKKKMIIALAMCTALTFSFTGCGDSADNNANSITSSDSEISADISADQDQPEEVPSNGETAENGGNSDSAAGKQDEVKETPAGSQASNSSSSSQQKPQEPTQTSKPSASASSGSAGGSSSGSGNTSASAPEKKAPAKADAQAFIGKSASSMIAAIGAPASKSYASSCMGDGEDGELHYSGFTVYTYKEGSSEKVTDVE